MPSTQEMLQSHPSRKQGAEAGSVAPNVLASPVEVLQRCAGICTMCADACLGEDGVESLRHCIRTDLDCADICQATAAILARQTEPDHGLIRAQLQACITSCQVCAAECRSHADHHEHCRICAETCEECERACQQVLDSLVE
jgi:hypothetical protein